MDFGFTFWGQRSNHPGKSVNSQSSIERLLRLALLALHHASRFDHRYDQKLREERWGGAVLVEGNGSGSGKSGGFEGRANPTVKATSQNGENEPKCWVARTGVKMRARRKRTSLPVRNFEVWSFSSSVTRSPDSKPSLLLVDTHALAIARAMDYVRLP